MKHRLLDFLIGAGKVFCLFPQSSRMGYTNLISEPLLHDSVTAALKADWENVGMDIEAAIATHEQPELFSAAGRR